MKLAAVASAAIMMAPVALNSVSTFAETTPAGTAAQASAAKAADKAKAQAAGEAAGKAAAAKAAADAASAKKSADMAAATQANMAKQGQTTMAQEAAASAAAKPTQASLASAQKAVDAAQTLYNALPSAAKNSTKGNILLSGVNRVKAAIAARTDSTELLNAATTLADASKNVFTTSTGNATTGTGTIADTTNKSTQASDAAKSAAAKQALIDALNQQIKGLEAEEATTTNKSTLASLKAQVAALNARINDLKGNTVASTPNKSTEASDAAKAAAKAKSRQTGVLKVTYVKGYGIQVWTKDGKMVASDAKGAKAGDKKKLQDGTSWKVFGPSVNINGHNMYCVGGNQYVDAKYVSFTHSVDLAK
jgi:hypothetical protein